MAGIGPAPKPDADRRRANAPTFGWVDLPAEGRTGPTPPLPAPPPWLSELGGWPVATRVAWAEMWRSPQATQWAPSGISLHHWAEMHAVAAIKGPTAAALAELRQIEDRHGLNPAALLRLRWRIADREAQPPADAPKAAAAKKPKDRRARVLRLVADGEATG